MAAYIILAAGVALLAIAAIKIYQNGLSTERLSLAGLAVVLIIFSSAENLGFEGFGLKLNVGVKGEVKNRDKQAAVVPKKEEDPAESGTSISIFFHPDSREVAERIQGILSGQSFKVSMKSTPLDESSNKLQPGHIRVMHKENSKARLKTVEQALNAKGFSEKMLVEPEASDFKSGDLQIQIF